MNNSFNLLFACLLFSALQLSAQDDNWKRNIPNPVSPKTFEFIKYTETPVSHYTGIPKIEIPLYTIQAAGYEVPLSLTYHAGGIRVSEEASSVGLGWTLQGGASIVQAINGDEDNFGGGTSPFIDPFELNMPGGMQNCDSKNMLYSKSYGLIEPTWGIYGYFDYTGAQTIGDLQLTGYDDTKPDVFKFSVGSYSGEFMFDYDLNKFICITNKSIMVRSNLPTTGISRPTTIYITVPEGHTFYFQLQEKTIIKETYSVSIPISQGSGRDTRGLSTSKVFQLTKIVTNKGDVVNFLYVNSPEIINYPTITQTLTQNTLYYPNAGTTPPHVIAGPGLNNYYPPYVTNTNYTVTKQTYSYLQAIETEKVFVEFIYSSSRLDMVGGKQLDRIIVKNNTHNNNEIRKIDFSYGYFQGHSQGTNIDEQLIHLEVFKTADEKLKRLKLNSVSINAENPYEFLYNTTQLPGKTSLAYDHLGFYNQNLTAQIGGLQTLPISHEGTKAAVLESIKYPTGGKTKFEYEQNGTKDPEPVQVPIGFEEYEGQIFMSDKNTSTNPSIGTIGAMGYQPAGYAVWINVPHSGKINIRRHLTVAGPCSDIKQGEDPYYPNTYWKIQHYNKDAQDMVDAWGWSAITGFVGNTQYRVKEEVGMLKISEGDTKSWEFPSSSIYLPEGVYWFNINLNDACGPQTATGPQGEAIMNFDYTVRKSLGYKTEMQYPFAPGLRVKQITAYDENEKIVVQREYKYFGPKLMSPIQYDYTRFIRYDYWDFNVGNGNPLTYRIQVNSHTTSSVGIFSPSSSASGKFVGYDRVQEHVVDHENASLNGYKEMWYQNQPDKQETNNAQMPLIRNDLDNGLLLKEVVYKADEIDPISETNYVYSVKKEPCYWSFMAFMDGRVALTNLDAEPPMDDIYEIGFYPIKRIQSVLSGKTTSTKQGGSTFTTTENYVYDSHNQISESVSKSSKDATLKIIYKYPYDFAQDLLAQQMVTENNISSYFEIEKYSAGSTILQQKFDYKEIGQENGPLQHKFFDLSKVKSRINSTVDYQLKADFQIYDQHRILQLVLDDGLITSYIWGYNNEYIVAKITGATHNEAAALVNPVILNNPQNDAALRAELNKLRTGLPGAMVTTYTHQPGVGLTSVTDTNGITTFYEYDDKFRLKTVSDNSGNITTFNKYIYVRDND